MNNYLITLSLCMTGFAMGQIDVSETCALTPTELQSVLDIKALMLRTDLKKGQKLSFSFVEYNSDSKKEVKTKFGNLPLIGEWLFAKNGPVTIDYKLVLQNEYIMILHNGRRHSSLGLPEDWAKEIYSQFQVLSPSLISLKRISAMKDGRFILSNVYLCLKIDVIDVDE